MNVIITPVIVMAIMGGVFAFLLGVVSKLTYVPVDPKITEVREALPGANCGACGYPGCDGCAAAIAGFEAPVNACPVGGEKVAEKVAEIMGVDSANSQRMVASVKCQGSKSHTRDLFDYSGVTDCRLMDTMFGGGKSCRYGCLGCGTCEDVCNYDAIRMVNGVSVIDEDKCVACLACINVCPKHIIELVPYRAGAQVKCKNPEFGKAVTSNCSIGCMGCGICARTAPNEFKLDGKLAYATYHEGFDMELARQAAEKCPTKAIVVHSEPDVNAVVPVEEEEKELVNA